MAKRWTLLLAGDCMLGRGVWEEIEARGPKGCFSKDVLEVFHSADLRLVNLECALTREKRPWPETKAFSFRAEPAAVEVLKLAKIDAVTLANNHVLDFGFEGLLETLSVLDRAKIAHAGAGKDQVEAWQPAIISHKGLPKIALISLSDNEPSFAATKNRPGIAYTAIATEKATFTTVARMISHARNQADLVILSPHWGPNMVERPFPNHVAFAQQAIEAGADLIFGHSAHIFQGIEIFKGKPILYDGGDLLDDYAVDPILRNDRSLLFLLHYQGVRLRSLELVPIQLKYAHTRLAQGEEFDWILERIRLLAHECGTLIERRGNRLAVELASRSPLKAGWRPPSQSRAW